MDSLQLLSDLPEKFTTDVSSCAWMMKMDENIRKPFDVKMKGYIRHSIYALYPPSEYDPHQWCILYHKEEFGKVVYVFIDDESAGEGQAFLSEAQVADKTAEMKKICESMFAPSTLEQIYLIPMEFWNQLPGLTSEGTKKLKTFDYPYFYCVVVKAPMPLAMRMQTAVENK